MYRNGDEYERMAKLAISVIMDYGVKEFPLDMDKLIHNMGINLVPYSAYEEKKELLIKKSKDGFYLPRCKEYEATILYNDDLVNKSTARINSTKGHEIKHIIENDLDDDEDDLVDYFSKYLRCPIPYVLYLQISNKIQLISQFGLSDEQACYVIINLENRRAKYGNGFFEYEIELLRFLMGDDYKTNDLVVIKNRS